MLHAATIITRWNGQEYTYSDFRHSKWYERLHTTRHNCLNIWDAKNGVEKSVTPLIAGCVISVDHFMELMEAAQLDHPNELTPINPIAEVARGGRIWLPGQN